MFIMYALLSFFFWGIADLFYKKGNSGEGKYNHIKTGIIVGIVAGFLATTKLLKVSAKPNFTLLFSAKWSISVITFN